MVDYSAAKAALVNVAKSLSKEFGPRGIRFNTIDPGPVATDLWLGETACRRTPAGPAGGARGVAERRGAAIGDRPVHPPDEVADLVLLLASDRPANVTGADVVIDGGMVTTI